MKLCIISYGSYLCFQIKHHFLHTTLKLLPFPGFPRMGWKPLSSSLAALVATAPRVTFTMQMLVGEVIWEPPELPAVPQTIRHKGKREKWQKNPKTTVHQHRSPGGLQKTLTTTATAGGPICTSPSAALWRDSDANTGVRCRVAAHFVHHTPPLLTSSQTSSPSPWVKQAPPDPTKHCQGAQSLTSPSSSPHTTGTLHPVPVVDLHPTSPWALCPQRCHDP